MPLANQTRDRADSVYIYPAVRDGFYAWCSIMLNVVIIFLMIYGRIVRGFIVMSSIKCQCLTM